jgi:hypothetical protein
MIIKLNQDYFSIAQKRVPWKRGLVTLSYGTVDKLNPVHEQYMLILL